MSRCPTLSVLAAFLIATQWMPTSTSTPSATQNPDPGTGNYPIPPVPHLVTTVIHHGTPLWVFALVAVVAMCLAIAATLAWQSVRAHRAERTNVGRFPAHLNQTSPCRGG